MAPWVVRQFYKFILQLQRASGGSGSTRALLVKKRVRASRIGSFGLSLDSVDVQNERTQFWTCVFYFYRGVR